MKPNSQGVWYSRDGRIGVLWDSGLSVFTPDGDGNLEHAALFTNVDWLLGNDWEPAAAHVFGAPDAEPIPAPVLRALATVSTPRGTTSAPVWVTLRDRVADVDGTVVPLDRLTVVDHPSNDAAAVEIISTTRRR